MKLTFESLFYSTVKIRVVSLDQDLTPSSQEVSKNDQVLAYSLYHDMVKLDPHVCMYKGQEIYSVYVVYSDIRTM